ncbi:MAG TPA: hypothetical protein VK630_06940 [Reyranella sp.]|nr:hypothetical protein [Reyranella sp.]
MPITDDTIVEPTENFFFNLSAPSNAVIAAESNQVTEAIVDDDRVPPRTPGSPTERRRIG